MAEVGNDEFSSRRERRIAQQKVLFRSRRPGRPSTDLAVVPSKVVLSRAEERERRDQKSRNRATVGRVTVMAVAFGLVSTIALPAYAFNPASQGVDVSEFQARLAADSQTVTVDSTGSAAATRDGYTTTEVVSNVGSTAPRYARESVDVSSIQSNSALLNAALSLVGMPGDCTAFVEEALRMLGYSVGDVGPMGFGDFGTVFYDPSQVLPGDIMMRGGHVAIYAGGGLAAQGGIGFMSYLTSTSADPNEYSAFVRVG